MVNILLDGDWILYTAGFACQHTEYVALDLDKRIFNGPYENRTAMNDDLGKDHDYAVYGRTFVDPLDHTLHTVKQMIASVEEAVSNKFEDEVKVTVYLDGVGNFRTQLATIAPYKGNRKDASKPILYEEIRKYLLDNHECVIADGYESDDAIAMAMNMSDGKCIAVGVDKDLLQIPGYHYNPNKGFKKVGAQEGAVRVFRQALTGDSTDNIKGAYKIGPKGAEKIIPKDMDPAKMSEACIAAYEETIDKYGPDIYGGLDGREAFYENYNLVYLLRHPDELVQ